MSAIFQTRSMIKFCSRLVACTTLMATSAHAGTVRLTVENFGGATPVTPVFAAFHDGSYDIAQRGGSATAGLESLAELGMNGTIAGEFGTAGGRVSVNVGMGRSHQGR